MNKGTAIKLTNYVIAILLILLGTAFSMLTKGIMPFFIGFTAAAVLIAIYRNLFWDYKERRAYFKNSLAEMKKQLCTFCGNYNPWWSEYCTNCGKKIPKEEIECNECYNLNPPLSTYCGVCGEKLDKENKKQGKENEPTKEQDKKESTKKGEEKTNEPKKPTECPECGYDLSLNVRKCPWCGNKINE